MRMEHVAELRQVWIAVYASVFSARHAPGVVADSFAQEAANEAVRALRLNGTLEDLKYITGGP